MRVGLIADTHIPEARSEVWPQVYEAFLGREPPGPRVDIILHAGDIHVPSVLDRLEEVVGVPVIACRGNGDDGDGGRAVYPGDDPRIEPHQVVSLFGHTLGLTHALVLPEIPPYFTLEAMMERKFGRAVDIIVHGDTHVPDITWLKGVLCVNPGSPTYPRNLTAQLGTIGFLDVDPVGARPSIIQLK